MGRADRHGGHYSVCPRRSVFPCARCHRNANLLQAILDSLLNEARSPMTSTMGHLLRLCHRSMRCMWSSIAYMLCGLVERTCRIWWTIATIQFSCEAPIGQIWERTRVRIGNHCDDGWCVSGGGGDGVGDRDV